MNNVLQSINFAGVLRYSFFLVLLIDGIDKFFNLVTFWPMYLAPLATDLTNLPADTLLAVLGGVEIVIAFLVGVWPKVGAVFAAMLFFGISANLIIAGKFYNIVLIDILLGITALALAQHYAAPDNGSNSDNAF